MHGAPAALKKAICSAIRSFSAAISPSRSRPENQPPHTETPYRARMGLRTAASIGKRRPVSTPVKPAALAWRRHSSRLTSSLSCSRSSFHQAIGAMPSLAFMPSHPDPLLRTDLDLLRPGFAHGGPLRDLRHAHIPVGVARDPGERVGVDGDDGGAIVLLRPLHRLIEVGEALAAAGERPHRFGVSHEVDRERPYDLAVADEVVEAWGALGVLQAGGGARATNGPGGQGKTFARRHRRKNPGGS